MPEERKEVWSLDVKRESTLKVVFGEPLTKAEAINAFHDHDYEDVIDEEDFGSEVVAAH